ncbi:MAG: hypothetical protein ACJ78Q_03595 [Chloroflexia bacterium]
MIDRAVRIVSEDLARVVDRRKFLKEASGLVFAGMCALAVGQVGASRAFADGEGGKSAPLVPVCNPPGPYCNLDGNFRDPNGCHGSACYQHLYLNKVLQCRLWYDLYQSGCWTTQVSGGYWVCCDCECGTPRVAACGCAKWSGEQNPRPDSPDGGYA